MKPSFLIATLAALSVASYTGCTTNSRTDAANFLTSPTNQAIIQFASNAAATSLVAAIGTKVPTTVAMQQAEQVAIATLLDNVTSDLAYSAAKALRSQQGTPSAAAAAPLTTAVTQAGAPSIAPTVAAAVTKLTSAGVPANAANEAIASALDAVAKKTGH